MTVTSPRGILGMGNPLLDISCDVDSSLLSKFGLKPNDAILAEPKHKDLYEEMKKDEKVLFIPGGATLNSVRVANWMLQGKGECSYMGCVGLDKEAELMKEGLNKEGVRAFFLEDEGVNTGRCAVCVTDEGQKRSLVADLGAANNYKVSHLKSHLAELERAGIIYSAGFFTTVCPEAMELASSHASEQGKVYALNLSAPFIVEVPPFREVVLRVLPSVDFLFGNETEMAALGKAQGWGEDLVEVGKKLAEWERHEKKQGTPRKVLITQGPEETLLFSPGEEVIRLPVEPLSPSSIVDTNAAGDAYVGGFLAALSLSKPVEECHKSGAYAASEVIRRSGCTYPEKPQMDL